MLLSRFPPARHSKPFWRDGDPQIPKSKWWLPEMDIIGFRVALSEEKNNIKSDK